MMWAVTRDATRFGSKVRADGVVVLDGIQGGLSKRGAKLECDEKDKNMSNNDSLKDQRDEDAALNGICSAYPTRNDFEEDGLTKRELFAAMIMQGMMTIPDSRTCPEGRVRGIWRAEMATNDANHCVMVADALLFALTRPDSHLHRLRRRSRHHLSPL